jgi:tetratricopeptide (TPR) repeat protein
LIFITITRLIVAQTAQTEQWRQEGNTLKNSGDYRAAISYFEQIYQNDSTDLEAINALGACYGYLGQNEKSIIFYEKARIHNPEDMQQYFLLAAAVGNSGDMQGAIDIYGEVMKIDDTYSEAWAGIGKMYYWMGKPVTAMEYYRRAIELDPGNEEIMKELKNVEAETDYSLTIHSGPVKEIEENYEIDALTSKLGFEKRFADNWLVQAGLLFDYSYRDYSTDAQDTARWYSNAWLKTAWITRHHTLAGYGGYSYTDNKLSSYGINWKFQYNPGKFSIKNSFNGGYDYFYYWNKVGSTSFTDELKLEYSFLSFNINYTYGIVDAVNVYKQGQSGALTEKENPYQSYGLAMFFRILKNPEIKLGLQHSYLDYQYKSPLYYSPFGRTLTGATTTIYYKVSKFYIYGSFAYNLGQEYDSSRKKSNRLNVDNWSTGIELGYDVHPFSFSVGGSNFYNPYYQNVTAFVAIKIMF